jgi:indole-3-glycerol phosphate synthase
MTILDRIVETKRIELQRAKTPAAEANLLARIRVATPPRDFFAACTAPGEVRVIAEIKKASPSVGLIRADFDPVTIARTYEDNGAACLSVLTDETYFQGRLEYLTAVKAAVGIPVLRKEFIIDRFQLLEARAAGADAVLLIAEILPGERLKQLHDDARTLGLHVLVEFHDADQLPRVLECGANLIGINNRDLRTFETRLSHTTDLMTSIPQHIAVVGESGIRTHDDLIMLGNAGVKAVLVGESLMREADIGSALKRLRGRE